jgi:hypothetical protein
MAKIQDKPRPSTQVYLLPGYGSTEAKRTGLVCVGGTAMRKHYLRLLIRCENYQHETVP